MECKSNRLRALLARITAQEERYKHLEFPKALPLEKELKACVSDLSLHAAKDEALDFRRCQSRALTYLKEPLDYLEVHGTVATAVAVCNHTSSL